MDANMETDLEKDGSRNGRLSLSQNEGRIADGNVIRRTFLNVTSRIKCRRPFALYSTRQTPYSDTYLLLDVLYNATGGQKLEWKWVTSRPVDVRLHRRRLFLAPV